MLCCVVLCCAWHAIDYLIVVYLAYFSILKCSLFSKLNMTMNTYMSVTVNETFGIIVVVSNQIETTRLVFDDALLGRVLHMVL